MKKNSRQYAATRLVVLLSSALLLQLQAVAQIDTSQFPVLKPDTIIEGLPPVYEEQEGVKVPDTVTISDYDGYDDDEEYEEEETVSSFHPLWMTSHWPDSVKQKKLSLLYKKKLQEDGSYWYANTSFAKKEQQKQKNNFRQPFTRHPVFQTLLWLVIIGGFAAIIIMYLYQNNIGIFRRNKKIAAPQADEQEDVVDIFNISYQQQIDKAVSAANYRLAIRLQFLSVLRQLADRGLIQYRTDNTNFDYLLQLQPTTYYQEFFALVRHYEYSWYGMFEVDAAQYQKISNQFQHFQQRIK